jgi:hypothetical protein
MTDRTFRTFGEAVNDPTSNIARFVAAARPKMERNERAIRELMATGLTREQAWAKHLRGAKT